VFYVACDIEIAVSPSDLAVGFQQSRDLKYRHTVNREHEIIRPTDPREIGIGRAHHDLSVLPLL